MREATDLLGRIEVLEAEIARLKAVAPQPPPGRSDAIVPASFEGAGAEPSSRRDLLRCGAAALGVAAAAAGIASPARADNGDPLILGTSVNRASASTWVATTDGYGLAGYSQSPSHAGVAGDSYTLGVFGTSLGTSGVGVQGDAYSESGANTGVRGRSWSPDGVGVHGINGNGGNAVRAEVPWGSANTIALYALNYSTYTGAGPGAGGFAIYGLSAKGHGLVGATASAGAAAVVGATNGVAGAYAGAFYGPLIVSGNFTVVGGAKSAAVPHPDGSHRRLYCIESPESWFEDFGRARLVCGEAVVTLDRDFAAVVDTSDYHVFLTANDGPGDLLACDRTSEGFRVKAASGAGDGTFSWRVVAKRKDIAAPRFETVVIPREPELPPVPASATATEPPRMTPSRGRSRSKA